jgi:hypothetical protein
VGEFPWADLAGWLHGADGPSPDPWASDHTLRVRRHRLDTARDWLLSGGSVLFFGPAGAGKSAALDVLVAGARGWRVLECLAGRTRCGPPYGALRQLLAPLTDAELRAAGDEESETLLRVTGRVRGTDTPPPAAVRWAVLDLVRRLGRAGPVVLVLDEVEALDEPSADVLRFVARQVEELPVRVAAAECVTGHVVLAGRGVCPAPLLAVQLDGLVLTGSLDAALDAPDTSGTVPWWRRRGAGGTQ